MEQSEQPKVGRGRGRIRNHARQQEPPLPSIIANEIEITSKLSENINNQLSDRLATSTTITSTPSSFRRLPRPDELGTLGDKKHVLINYFSFLQFPQQGFVFRYYIEIQNKGSQIIRRHVRRMLYECWLKELCRKHPQIDRNRIVFDNSTAIFTYNQQLPDINETESVEKITGPNRSNRYQEYQISIRQVGKPIDFSLLRSLEQLNQTNNNQNINDLIYIKQVLGIVLHEHCSSQADYIYNRTYFTNPTSQDHGHWDLGLGKAAWRGFYSCLVFANGTHQLLMNLDVSHGVFMKRQPFLDFLCQVMINSPCGRHREKKHIDIDEILKYFDRSSVGERYQDEIEYLSKHCKNLRVRLQTSYGTMINEICDLGESAFQQTFDKGGREMTVVDYYQNQYGQQLQYPSLPILKMRNKLVIPMEVLEVEPIKVKKVTDEQRAKLSRCSLLKPLQYYQSIKATQNNSKQHYFGKTPISTAWNFQINTDMHKTTARVLPMPDVIYTDKYRVTGDRCRSLGVWKSTNTPFHKPTNFPSVWAFINLSSCVDKQTCEKFYVDLKRAAAGRGIKCSPPLIYEEYRVQPDSIDQIIAAVKVMMKQNNDCQFLIVVLPEDTHVADRVYGELKKLCELESGFGIVSQMINANTIKYRRENDDQWDKSTLDNILLKINVKLDGINSIIHVPDVIERFFRRGHKIMYVGVDLSHPPSGSTDQRSIAAVVASADDVPSRYFKEIYIQNRFSSTRKEIGNIVSMKEIMKSLIRQYKQHRQYPPHAIVIYRNGIADSEFDTVFVKELTATREACVELSAAYQPYLTYIVVNKRHHTRVLPDNLKDNIVAGTVVDSHDVTNPLTYNFFLKSHDCQLGTSRPTHYHVLYDDNQLKPDEIQMLTYALCYMFPRCTRSISIPTPVKFANLLAERAKLYLPEIKSSSTNQLNTATDGDQTNFNIQIRLSPKLVPDAPFFL